MFLSSAFVLSQNVVTDENQLGACELSRIVLQLAGHIFATSGEFWLAITSYHYHLTLFASALPLPTLILQLQNKTQPTHT